MRHAKKDKNNPQVALAGGMGTVAVPHTHAHHARHARKHGRAKKAEATTTAAEQNLAPEASDVTDLAPVEAVSATVDDTASSSTETITATVDDAASAPTQAVAATVDDAAPAPTEAVSSTSVTATRVPGVPDAEDVLAYSDDGIVADQPIAEATDFSAEDDYEASIPKHEANAYTNIWGIIGFAVSIFAICGGWWLFLGWIPWLVGLVISFIAVFRPPRAFAIAGLSISGAYFIVWMILLGLGVV